MLQSPPIGLLDIGVPPVSLDENELRRHCRAADAALLLGSALHVTGDMSLIDRFGPLLRSDPKAEGAALSPMRVLPDEAMTELIDIVACALCHRRRAGYTQVLDTATFHVALEHATGETVPLDFVPALMQQAGFVLSREHTASDVMPTAEDTVLIVGAGMAGIAVAIGLAEAGFPFELVEASHDIGGTWRLNTYPGVAVDTPTIHYSYSFEQEAEWTRHYPTGAEYQAYLQKVVDRYGIREHIRFGTRLDEMRWDEETRSWHVLLTSREGQEWTRARFVVTAAGYLNRPQVPRLEGADTFGGIAVHSAEIDPQQCWTGRKVGVIGAGATAVQIVDSIIDEVESLAVFQRQPHWVRPNQLADDRLSDSERWLRANVPFYQRWQRAKEFWFASDRSYEAVRIDPDWIRDHDLSISRENHAVLESALGHLKASFADRPDLLRKLTPTFPPHGKRMVRDPGGYYTALANAKTTVIDEAITRLEPEGVRTADGSLIELDMIVFATGFTLDFLNTITVVGREGETLADRWRASGPRAYLGGTVPGFPNLFITSGPNSISGHGGGHAFVSEVAQHYVVACLREVVARGASWIEVRAEAEDRFHADLRGLLSGSIWSRDFGAHTYYVSESGTPVLPNPWRLSDYWQMTRRPDSEAFTFGR